MGGQLDGIFLAGSLPHEFVILIVTLFICLWLINFSPSLSLSFAMDPRDAALARYDSIGGSMIF